MAPKVSDIGEKELIKRILKKSSSNVINSSFYFSTNILEI